MKKFSGIFFSILAIAAYSAELSLANNNFARRLYGWQSPSYWGGKLTHTEENGKKFLRLTATKLNERIFARAHGFCSQKVLYPGALIKIEVKLKGTGKFNAGLLRYALDPKSGTQYTRGKALMLDGKDQVWSETIVLTERLGMILPFFEIEGEGSADITSFTMKSLNKPGASIRALSSMQVCKTVQEAQKIRFAVALPDKKVYISRVNGKNVKTIERTFDGNELVIEPEDLKAGLNEIQVSGGGVAASCFIDVTKEADADSAVAGKVKVEKPLHCLFLGDSLTEFYPGRNYFARIQFWLNKYNPGKTYLYNYGIGGDQILRMESRLKSALSGKNPAYRQSVYKDLFSRQYDVIFLWLGHNDTVTSRISKHGKFARPQIMPEEQEAAYRRVIALLREHNPGVRIVLISPSPSDVKRFERYDKKYAPSTQIHMFGKPEFVAAFDAVNRKLVKELKLDYLDMHAVMIKHDIPSLYVADGVHLSNFGATVAAREFLRFFAENKLQALPRTVKKSAPAKAAVKKAPAKAAVKKAPAVVVDPAKVVTIGRALARNDFNRSTHSWLSPSYWPGKITHITENGKKYLELVSGFRDKEEFARAHGHCRNVNYYPDTMILITLRVKGEGRFNTGLLRYAWGSGKPEYMRSREYTLTPEFQEIKFVAVLPERQNKILPLMEIQGRGRAVVERFEMFHCKLPGTELSAVSGMQVCKDAKDVKPLQFKANVPEVFLTYDNSKAAVTKTVRPQGGNLTVVPEQKLLGSGVNRISISRNGSDSSCFVDINKEFDTDDAIARSINVKKEINCLFIGGSHCEFYPGQNFIARLGFWLGKYNPGKVRIYNFGVAGDHIKRVEQRLNCVLTKQNPAWRQDMYKKIFDQKYDYIFTFLGQNDTVTSRISKHGKFARPQIMPDEQEKAYRRVFKILQEKNPGVKVVIIAPSPSHAGTFEAYDKRFSPGTQIHMFGKKEFLDAYDAVSRKLAKEYNFDHIDMLNTMRNTPDMRSLYGADAVHLTPRGGMIVARGILEYFSRKFPAGK